MQLVLVSGNVALAGAGSGGSYNTPGYRFVTALFARLLLPFCSAAAYLFFRCSLNSQATVQSTASVYRQTLAYFRPDFTVYHMSFCSALANSGGGGGGGGTWAGGGVGGSGIVVVKCYSC